MESQRIHRERVEVRWRRTSEELWGADLHAGTVQITLLSPRWVGTAKKLSRSSGERRPFRCSAAPFRGATAFPPGRGVWRDDEREGQLLFEQIVLVTSYELAAK